MARAASRRCRALIELCCDDNSGLSKLAGSFGIEAKRITRDERFDLRRGVNEALSFIGAREDVDAWAALPCTAWCTWSYVNTTRLGPQYVARLAWRRRQSVKMVGHVEECIAAAVASGGAGHFEWPRRCRGWQRLRVRRMLARLQMLLADFDGCSFGVMAAPGLLALKPWRLATTRPELAEAFAARRCSRDHLHGTLSGAWATRWRHYTEEMCRLALGAMTRGGAEALLGRSLPAGSAYFPAALGLADQLAQASRRLQGVGDPRPQVEGRGPRQTLSAAAEGLLDPARADLQGSLLSSTEEQSAEPRGVGRGHAGP